MDWRLVAAALCFLNALGVFLLLVMVWVAIGDLRLRRKVSKRGCVSREVPPELHIP